MAKTFGDTYLFGQYDEYNKKLLNFIMTGTEIDTTGESFADVLFDIKRQNIGVSIANIATSANVKLMMGTTALPKQFKVFVAKDLRGKKRDAVKVYIDCTDIMRLEGGKYRCTSIDTMIAYLISAMTSLIYHADEKRILMNAPLTQAGTSAYSTIFTHIVDYLFKISISPEVKAKCKYLTSRFYLEYVLGKTDRSSIGAISSKIAGISDREERVIEIGCNDKSFTTLNDFIGTLNHILKVDLTLDAIIDKWMFLYGPSTVFGIEFFPAFSAMLTDAYCGCYMNNQKTIEKLAGKDMVDFTKAIFVVGANALKGD